MKTANLTIVFTDLVGFAERSSRLPLEQTQALLRTHRQLVAPIFRAFSGKILKEVGDAFLVTFESPTQAVLAGIALQDRLWGHNRERGNEEQLVARVAINAGEVRVEGGDVFGEPVNIAARIQELAQAGDVTFTEAVYLAMNKAEVPAEELGSFELKGIPEKLKVFKVPRAPYRVEPVVAGTAAPPVLSDLPPFGNLGLQKMPEGAGAEVAARAVELGAQAVAGSERLVKNAVQQVSRLPVSTLKRVGIGAGAVAAVLLLLVGGVKAVKALSGSSLERAVLLVEEATPAEKEARVEAALKLLGTEKNEGVRLYWSGRLQQARGEANAADYYATAINAGFGDAEQRLSDQLSSDSCEHRVAALEAVRKYRLKQLRSRVEQLAKSGGPDDRAPAMVILGKSVGGYCSSRQTAERALRELE